MTQALAAATISPDEGSEALSNFDRLRSHLKTDSLAHALLDAWEGAIAESDRARAMMDALETFHTPEQEEDEQGTTEEN
jgi:hypothetical protein